MTGSESKLVLKVLRLALVPSRACRHLLVVLALIALIPISLSPVCRAMAQPASEPELVTRIYDPQFLPPDVAGELVGEICSGKSKDVCEFHFVGGNRLVLTAVESAHRQFAALLAERDVPPPTQEFEVILLSATRTGTVSPDLPERALAAIKDLQGFLPFAGYRLLDTGWIRTSGHAAVSLGEAGAFQAGLHFKGNPKSGKLLVEHFDLTYRDWYRVEGKVAYSEPRMILASSFGIGINETVVVGTSKLDGGDEAVVVLLSALP